MKKLLLLFLLLMASLCFGQGAVISGTVMQCDSDVIVPSATIRVGTSAATGTGAGFAPLASIYSDVTLLTAITQPTTTDICGDFAAGGVLGTTIYAAPGEYIVQITGSSIAEKKIHITVGGANHNLLSATHSDSTASSASRGAIITGQGTGPTTWQKLTKGAANRAVISDGTDVTYSSVGMGGAGDCSGSNTFVQDINPNAAPDCATVGTSNVSAGILTKTQNIVVFDPVAGDSGRIQFELPKNSTITRVYCNVKAATSVVIQLNKRAEATPDVAGTDVLTSALTCPTGGGSTTSFASAAVTLRTPVAVTFSSVTGTPDTLRIAVEYTTDSAQ